MNVIKVKFNIDIDNEQQVRDLNVFMAALKSNEGTSPVIESPVKDVQVKKPVEAATPAQPATESTQDPNVSKKLDAIRKLISQKAGVHREVIKAKLVEFGAPTATDLTVDRYQEFHVFLEGLS
jgi:hypothetical protein